MKYFIVIALFLSNLAFSLSVDDVEKNELINPKTNGKIWVYLPSKNTQEKLPVVLVPPAGTRLFHGIKLSSGDIAEHIPYVKQGFAVISFDISGLWPEVETNQNIYVAANTFISRNAGIDDAKEALILAKSKYSNLSLDDVYIAGHSSAGTLALMAAKQMPEIKAVIAYAPVLDLSNYLSYEKSLFKSKVSDFNKILIGNSPHKKLHKYTMPIFLFSAKDDEHMSDQRKSYNKFVKKLNKKGVNLTYQQVETGGHYQSMIDEGIPSAINWLKKIKTP